MATTTTTTTTAAAAITVLANIQDPEDTKNVYFQSGGYRLSRPVLTGQDAKRTFDSIPTVDMSSIYSPDPAVRKAIAAEVAKVCEDVGFFYAANPPVSYEKMDAAMDMIKTFFRLPQDELLKLHVDNSQGVKGYLPFAFRDGRRCRASYSLGRDYTNPEQHFVREAPPGTVALNQWPDASLPAFRKVIYEYYREVFQFARAMLQIFSLALGLDETDLDDTFRYPLNDITMQYYPVQDPNEQSSIVPHADYGGFTLLYQGTFFPLSPVVPVHVCTSVTNFAPDDVGGLEVLNANGVWVPAPPREHAYVVNTGSYMEVLSNGRFPATVHRAFGNPRCDRFSLPFFYNPDPDVLVAPHPKLLAKVETTETPGTTPTFTPQNVSRRQIKGLMSNRPNHPFFTKLRALGLADEELTFDLVTKPLTEIEAIRQSL